MQNSLILFLIALTVVAFGCAEKPAPASLEFRLAEAQPSSGLVEMVYSGWGQSDTFYVHMDVLISEEDVDEASVTTQNGYPAVALSLTEAGAVKFEQITGANVGRHLAMIVDGKLLSAPLIRDTIHAGKAILTGEMSEEEAHRIAGALSPD